MGFNLPILNRIRRNGGGFDWYPGVLYQPGDILLWYDPSDLTTMYQDVAGTSPVTADGQSVLLMLDKGGLSDGRGVVNRLTHSQQFDNAAWSKSNITVTADTVVAPDGTTTAYTLTETATSDFHSLFRTLISVVAGETLTLSAYAKPNSRNEINLYFDQLSANTAMAVFNVSAGVISVAAAAAGSFSAPSASIVAAANGFYRCTLTATVGSTGNSTAACELYNGGRSYLGDGTSGVHVWGMQYEKASVASAYQANGATVGGPGYHRTQATPSQAPKYKTDGTLHWLLYDGTDDGAVTPTIPWGTVTSDGAARRNLLVNPTQFDHTTWTKTDATVTANATTAPDGTTTADILIEGATTNVHRLVQTVSSGSVFSVFAKAETRSLLAIDIDADSANRCYFDLSSGLVSSVGAGVTASISDAGAGWYRCTISLNSGSAASCRIYVTNAVGVISYAGDGTSGIYIWGAQLELGSTATAFQNIGSDEVAICAGVTKSSDAAAGAVAELSASSSSNTGAFALFAPSTAATNFFFRSKGSTDRTVTLSPYTSPRTDVLTGIGDISADRADLRVNGALDAGTPSGAAGTGNFGNYPLYFGRRGGSSLPFNGKEHQTIIRSRLLSASELAKLEAFTAAKTGVIL